MLLAVVCGLILCQLGQADKPVLLLRESFEDKASWDEWNCTQNGTRSDIVRRHSGQTPSYGTGPSNATDGTYYIYYEDSGNSGKVICQSPVYLTPFPGGKCIARYNYHMWGGYMETLRINADYRYAGYSRSYSGNQGDRWHKGALGFETNPYNGEFRFYIEMNGNNDYRGDMAFDNLRVVCENTNSSGNVTWATDPLPTQVITTDKPTYKPVPTNRTKIPTRDWRTTADWNNRTTEGNTTDRPHPTEGEGEVRVKFGGVEVEADIPAFEAAAELGEVAEGAFYTLQNIVLYPWRLLHGLIYGYY